MADPPQPELPVTPPGRHWQPPPASSPPRPASPPPATPAARQQAELESYVEHLLAELRAKQAYADSLEDEVRRTRPELAELRARVAAAEAEAAGLRGARADAEARLRMTRYRIADIAHARLQQLPPLHAALRRAANVARAWRRRRRAG